MFNTIAGRKIFIYQKEKEFSCAIFYQLCHAYFLFIVELFAVTAYDVYWHFHKFHSSAENFFYDCGFCIIFRDHDDHISSSSSMHSYF
jgi:hypothetical protein